MVLSPRLQKRPIIVRPSNDKQQAKSGEKDTVIAQEFSGSFGHVPRVLRIWKSIYP